MEKVKFHFDPGCPWCYQTSRWARRLEELGEVELDWGVFSLEVVNKAEDVDALEIKARMGPALRSVIVIRRDHGPKAVGSFYKALGQRIWEQAPPESDIDKATLESLQEIGLDESILDEAMSDSKTWEAVLEEHNHLVERTRSFGVPTIVLDGGSGPAIFGPVISELPTDADAIELFRHVAWLARYENFSELKRGRSLPPDLPAAAWRREQRAKEEAEARGAAAKE